MPDHPADCRRALELLASLREGSTEALLIALGFATTTIAGLVASGLASSTTERVWAGSVKVRGSRSPMLAVERWNDDPAKRAPPRPPDACS
jgi:hypothetical protein